MNVQKMIKRIMISLFAVVLMLGSVDSSAFQVKANAATNVTFTVRAVAEIDQSGGEKLTKVKSGQPFFLAVNYTFSSPGDGYRYAGGTLQIQLPDQAEVDEAAISEMLISHDTIFQSWKQDGKYLYFYTLNNQTIASGSSGTLYIKVKYKNMETKNGYGAAYKEQFRNMEFTGSLIDNKGQSVPMDKIVMKPVSIINQANQTWSLYKSIVKQGNRDYTETDQYFQVEYCLELSTGDTKDAISDRFGRLSCNPFTFTDNLPSAENGIIKDGQVMGYPKHGGVQKVSIIANKGDQDQKILIAGKDYTLGYEEDDTTIKSIHFHYVNHSGGNSIPDHTPVNTTYTILASYPKAAYEIAGNESSFQKYHLVNSASLSYRPLGQTLQTIKADAFVDLGWVDPSAKHYDFAIVKQIELPTDIKGIKDVQDFDQSLQDAYYVYHDGQSVMFGLYMDQECTKPVKNYDGTKITGKPQAVDQDGYIHFEGLLAGNYYLKETGTIDGFKAMKVKNVVISKFGDILVDGKKIDKVYHAINKTNKEGFGYVLFWKKGNNASGESGYLSNITFTLTSKTDSSIVYRSSSDHHGRVLFTGVKAGIYTLKELDKGDNEFEALRHAYDVKVIGNQVNYPYRKDTKESLQKDGDQHPYLLNISKKGSIKIIKQDAITKAYLKGSEFVAYGPYVSKPQLTNFQAPQNKKYIHEISSAFTDGSKYFALEKGFYVLQEKQAPSNYVLDASFQCVYIKRSKMTTVKIANTEAGALQIKKTGAMSASLDFKVPLAGAEFTVYRDANAMIPAQDIDNRDAVLTTVMKQGEAISNLVKLKPGVYYLKETKTPEGYKDDGTITKIEIPSGIKHPVVKAFNNEVNKLGQLIITKQSAESAHLKLANVTFEIYDKCGRKIDSITTDSMGMAKSTILKPGKYTIKEVVALDNYSQSGTGMIFASVDERGIAKTTGNGIMVRDNTQVRVTVENKPHVTYAIEKVDQTTGEKIEGVEFALYHNACDAKRDTHRMRTKTTDVQGRLTFSGLEPGQVYYYKEIKSQHDYVMDNTVYSFTSPDKMQDFKQAEATIPKILNVMKGKFTVNKTLKDYDGTMKPLGGITFVYYENVTGQAEADWKRASTTGNFHQQTTDMNGAFTSVLLTPGQYWVKEVVMDGYQPAKTKLVEVKAKNDPNVSELVTVTNVHANGMLKVKKVDSLTNSPVAYAKFNVYRVGSDHKNDTKATPVSTFTLNQKGEWEQTLKPGHYVLIETDPDQNTVKDFGYVVDKTKRYPMRIKAGETNTVYFDQPIVNVPKGRFLLDKFEVWNKQNDGSWAYQFRQSKKFLIYADEACTKLVTSMRSNTIKSIYSPYLAAGDYWVKEVQDATDYLEAPVQKVRVKAGQNHELPVISNKYQSTHPHDKAKLRFENISKKAKLRITKIDSKTKQKLNHAEFELYQKTCAGTPGAIKLEGTGIFVKKVSDKSIITGTADSDGDGKVDVGEAFTDLLTPGKTYYVKEVKTPNGYQSVKEWTGPIITQKGEMAHVTVENFKSTSAYGQKTDDLGNPISDVFLSLFRDRTSAQQAVKILDKGNVQAVKNYIAKAKNPITWGSLGIVATARSTHAGTFPFKNLNTEGVYYAVEIETDDRYSRDPHLHTLTVRNVHSQNILYEKDVPFVLVNKRKGQIKVKKVISLSNQSEVMNGVNFTLYRACSQTDDDHMTTEGCALAHYTTGSKASFESGTFISDRLDAGWYILKEDQIDQPDSIDPSATQHTFKIQVKTGDINTVYYDKPIVNLSKQGKFIIAKESAQQPGLRLSATFTLQRLQAGTWETVTSIGNNGMLTVSKEMEYVSDLLDPGQYRLIEKSVDGHYTLDATPILFQIKAGKITAKDSCGSFKPVHIYQHPYIITNQEKGSLSLTKKGHLLHTDPYQPMPGVTFKVYQNSGNQDVDLQRKEVASAKTNSDGKLHIKNLDAGAYWIVETAVDETNSADQYHMGYRPDFKNGITITAGQNTIVTSDGKDFVANASIYGKIQIKKVDYKTKALLNGAIFGIYPSGKTDQEPIQTITTDQNGVALSDPLPKGEYYLKELSAPDHYLLDTTLYGAYVVKAGFVTTSGNDTMAAPAQIENRGKTYIEIIKQNHLGQWIDDENMKTSSFSLYKTKEHAQHDIHPLETITGGSTRFQTPLKPETTFWVRERKAPKGYVLDETPYAVTTHADVNSVVSLTLFNAPYGSLTIEKLAQWELPATSSTQVLPLGDVTFTLYEYKKHAVDHHGDKVETKQTDELGKLTFENLPAGQYVLQEFAPEGFAKPDATHNNLIVTVKAGEDNHELTKDHALINYPKRGKFTFTKTTIKDTEPVKIEETKVVKTTFRLQKQDDFGKYVDVVGYESIHPSADGCFESAMLKPGKYQLIETVAPDGFCKLSTPLPFTVVAKQITVVSNHARGMIVNQALGNIQITKYSDAHDYDSMGKKQPLTGVTFKLYRGDHTQMNNTTFIASKKTDDHGKIIWENLNPGIYTVKEASNPNGYAKHEYYYEVTVLRNQSEVQTYIPNQTNDPVYNHDGQIYNESIQGKLIIHKTSNTGKSQKGAVFNIYAYDELGKRKEVPIDIVTTKEDGYGSSKLLNAAKQGTPYLVREIKAPDGYSLDEQYEKLEKIVMVKPLQDSDRIITNYEQFHNSYNYTSFKNTPKKYYDQYTFHVDKGIMKVTGSRIVNNTKKQLYAHEYDKASTVDESDLLSLLESDSEITFKLFGFASGQNGIDAEKVVVSDHQIKMQYIDKDKYVDEHLTKDAYSLQSITLHRAYIDGSDENVKAEIQIQAYGQADSTWTSLKTIDHMQALPAEGVSVDLSQLKDKAIHFRVIYSNTKANFYADGIDFKARFTQRESNEKAHEIRRITNQGNVEYHFKVLDEIGKATEEVLEQQKTKMTSVHYPLLQASRPQVNINMMADHNKDGTKLFNPGDQVLYTLKVSNTSYRDSQRFDSPILSFDLPVGLTLDECYPNQSEQFMVMMGHNPSDGKTIDLKDIRIVESKTAAKELNDEGKLVPTAKKTKKITMFFDHLEVERGMNLFVRFATHISQGSVAVNNRIAPAYLSSSKTIAKSAENPYGNSFEVTSMGGAMVNDADLDQIIDGSSSIVSFVHPRYAFSYDTICIQEIHNLSIYQEAKGQADKEYKGVAQTAITVPNGSMDYRIVVKNGSTSTNKVTKARVLDILPFVGDTLVNRSNYNQYPTDRGTSIPKRPILEKDSIHVYDTDEKEIPNRYVTIYYCVDPVESWTTAYRAKISRELDLPMIYGNMETSAWAKGDRKWVRNPDGYSMDQVTAIGVEVDFHALKLAEGSNFTIQMKMTAPNFTVEEIDAITDKFFYNSAMCAVQRVAHESTEAIGDDNRSEHDPVKMKLHLPKGFIGDTTFLDYNHNGLQDATDSALPGVDVTLYTYRKGIHDVAPVLVSTKITKSDQTGYYHFDMLDCNHPLDGKDKDSKDPKDFIGNAIYSYRLKFTAPRNASVDSYRPTKQYVGNKENPQFDSNIDEDGMTDFIRLSVTTEKGGIIMGEDNLSIDAGFISQGVIGDYVWKDDNQNGIQDSDEKGISGFKVNLLEKQGDHFVYKKSVKTDNNGYYLFKDLMPNEYIVEFDSTSVLNPGYSHYAFTKNVEDENAFEVDSDARIMMPGSDNRIARTDVITLEDHEVNLSIDAGLINYSALSGCTFEDRNFDHLNHDKTADIPLSDALVSLYRVISGVREKVPYKTMKVDENGRYRFDKLLPGDYQVHFKFSKEYQIVTGNVGFEDTIDSDITLYEEGGSSGFTNVISLKENTMEEHLDGGAYRYSSLGDYVWNDKNKDGLQDIDESPVGNVRVYLQRKDLDQEFWTVQRETFTDDKGHYRFDHLEGSTYTGIQYRIVFDFPSVTKVTIPLNGNVLLDSNALPTYLSGWGFPTDHIELGYAIDDKSFDAGIVETSGSIGDYVWFDTNRNGIQDETGTGIAKVKVVLERNDHEDLKESAWVTLWETFTNESGYYRFDGLSEGYYRVKFFLPNANVTMPNQGNDIEQDADGMKIVENWSFTRPFYLGKGGYDMSWDCGITDGNPIFEVNTKDTTNLHMYGALMILSLGAVFFLYRRNMKW